MNIPKIAGVVAIISAIGFGFIVGRARNACSPILYHNKGVTNGVMSAIIQIQKRQLEAESRTVTLAKPDLDEMESAAIKRAIIE